jgi:hypothetical protein
MKPITLHPVSVLVALVLAGGFVTLVGAAQAPGGVQSIPTRDVRVLGQIPAEWWTFVYIDGTSFTFQVPADRTFVVTLIEGNGGSVLANGQPVGAFGLALRGVDASLPDSKGTRVTIAQGSLLTTIPGQGVSLWGYLEPVR